MSGTIFVIIGLCSHFGVLINLEDFRCDEIPLLLGLVSLDQLTPFFEVFSKLPFATRPAFLNEETLLG